MPLRDGKGPAGIGRGAGRGQGSGRMGGNRPGSGPGGNCICPSCGATVSHTRGVPCYTKKCPECGTRMAKQ